MLVVTTAPQDGRHGAPPGREVNTMTSDSSRQPAELDRNLARCGFTPHASNSSWLDRDTGQQTIRVVREPGEQTELIALTPHSACLYKAMFYVGTPDAIIIAAVETALTLSQPEPAARSGPARPVQPGCPAPGVG